MLETWACLEDKNFESAKIIDLQLKHGEYLRTFKFMRWTENQDKSMFNTHTHICQFQIAGSL